jgi:hypothetical protein
MAARHLMWPPTALLLPGQKQRPKMGEDTKGGLKDHVIALCTTFGLTAYHTHLSIQSTVSGFPDVVITGPGGTIFRELKGDGKEPTPVQAVYLDKLAASGQDAAWWNPDDWYSGRIRRELEPLRRSRTVGQPVPADRRVSAGDAVTHLRIELDRAAAAAGDGLTPAVRSALSQAGDRLEGLLLDAVASGEARGYRAGRGDRVGVGS